jgi:hypothetical protein
MYFSIIIAALFTTLALSSPLDAAKRQDCCVTVEVPGGVCLRISLDLARLHANKNLGGHQGRWGGGVVRRQ